MLRNQRSIFTRPRNESGRVVSHFSKAYSLQVCKDFTYRQQQVSLKLEAETEYTGNKKLGILYCSILLH
jgi:hypothetical protein